MSFRRGLFVGYPLADEAIGCACDSEHDFAEGVSFLFEIAEDVAAFEIRGERGALEVGGFEAARVFEVATPEDVRCFVDLGIAFFDDEVSAGFDFVCGHFILWFGVCGVHKLRRSEAVAVADSVAVRANWRGGALLAAYADARREDRELVLELFPLSGGHFPGAARAVVGGAPVF